jgi:hypothetical protein
MNSNIPWTQTVENGTSHTITLLLYTQYLLSSDETKQNKILLNSSLGGVPLQVSDVVDFIFHSHLQDIFIYWSFSY